MAARADIMAGRAYVSLFVKQDAFTRGLQNARRQLSQFGSDIQALGRQLVTISAAAIVPLGLATRTFANFDDAMRAVGAVTRASGSQLEAMTQVAAELGRTTSFTATQVAMLMTELGRAGFSPDQVNEMTGAVLDMARATGTDATISSGIMASAIRQFNLQASEGVRVADAFTAAANGSFNSVEQLGESLSYAGPIAADFNMSLEDTLALLGGLGNAGVQGSMAGTALRRLLLITGSEAKKLQGIFGVSFVDAAGNARPLVETLTEVQAATANLGTAAKAAKFEEAFGDLGITAASIIGKGGQSIRDLADEIKNAGGVAGATAASMDAGLGGAFRIIMSAAEGLQLAIGKSLETPLTKITKLGTDFLGAITRLVENNEDVVVSFAKWAAITGIVGVGLVALGVSVSALSIPLGGLLAVVGLLGVVMRSTLLPLNLLLFGIRAMTVAVATARSAWMLLVASIASVRAAMVAMAASTIVLTSVFGLLRFVVASTSVVLVAARLSASAAAISFGILRTVTMACRTAFIALRASGFALQSALLATSLAFALLRTRVIATTAAIFTFQTATRTARGLMIAVTSTLAAVRAGFVAVGSGAIFASTASAGLSVLGAILAAVTSPAVIAAAAVAAIGYYALQSASSFRGLGGSVSSAIGVASESLSAGLARMGQLFGELKITAVSAFGGIRDAIATGDLALAANIALTGVRIAFLQAMSAIDDIVGGSFGQTIATITSQIVGGDFAGAWNTIVLGMGNLWASFSNGIVVGFSKAAKSVITIWKSMVDSITNLLLRKAGEGGIFGKFFEQISGVNVKEEMERNEKLKAQEGIVRKNLETAKSQVEGELATATQAGDTEAMNRLMEELSGVISSIAQLDGIQSPDIFDQVQSGTYSDPATQEMANSANAAIEALRQQAAANLEQASGDVAAANAAGNTEIQSQIQQLEGQLAAMKFKASANLAYAANQPSDSAMGGVEGSAANPVAKAAGSVSTASAATSSVAGLIAASQGGGAENQVVKEMRERRKEAKQAEKQRQEDNINLIDAVNRTSGVMVA
jgi:TP901 family phage tail tape measure protein